MDRLDMKYLGVHGDPLNFYYKVAAGKFEHLSEALLLGRNLSTGSTATETVWDQGGSLSFLASNTQLYVSSTSSNDVGIPIVCIGVDEDYNPVTRTGITNGQNQVALDNSDTMIITVALVGGAISPEGEIYVATADSLTDGTPDNPSSIQSKIPLSRAIDGVTLLDPGTNYASDNISHTGVMVVPANHRLHLLRIYAMTNKDDNIRLGGRVRPFGGVWLNRNTVPIYQSIQVVDFDNLIPLAEKTILEFRAIGASPGSLSQVQMFGVLENLAV